MPNRCRELSTRRGPDVTEHGTRMRKSASDAHLGNGDHHRSARPGRVPKSSTRCAPGSSASTTSSRRGGPTARSAAWLAAELTLREVSAELRTVLELCDKVTEDSQGAFDIHVGADPRVEPREGLGPIDPSGLVKGWALQRAAGRPPSGRSDQLRHQRRRRRHHRGPTGRPGERWRVGIRHPWQRDKVAMVLDVSDLGVATSGRYERGDHIIDPRTGQPATGLMSVTVVARRPRAGRRLRHGRSRPRRRRDRRGSPSAALASVAISDDGTASSPTSCSVYREDCAASE